MSGIARGRLTEERKSWRKNHPHVRTVTIYTPLWFCFESLFFSRVCFDSNWFRFCFFFFCDLGFCCEARDTAWWFREFDDLALYYSWKNWGLFFSLIFYQFFFVDYEWIKLLSLFFVILIFLFLLCESWVSLSMILDLLTSLILHVGFVMMT